MSWTQRRGQARPTPTSNRPIQMYNPNQHSNSEPSRTQTWQQQQPLPQTIRQEPIQSYWQQTENFSTGTPAQYGQVPQQQDQASFFQNSVAGINQQQQAYGNVQFTQQYDQNNLYTGHQAIGQSSSNEWGNWGWGDDDNSNTQPILSQQPSALGDSFVTDESWNWTLTDSSTQQQNVLENNMRQEHNVNNLFPTIGDIKSNKTDNQVSRKKIETPQWSTESQPSLESSDDVLHTSESDKSHLVSRSSTISHSPTSGQDLLLHHQLYHQDDPHHHVENKEIVVKHERVNPTPPLAKNVNTPPLLVPPPAGSSEDTRNPYKRSGGLSHKQANKLKTTSASPNFNPGVNLETLPDNSEHPDPPLVHNAIKNANFQQWPQIENNEAPINDRNQYLETGQLSEANTTDTNEIDLSNDTLPPPGLQRMVPGQMEQTEIPAFSRMVLGQNGNTPIATTQHSTQFDLSGPPEGLHRMVPGESSSPETSLRQQNIGENDSEPELNQLAQNAGLHPPRSATIGADTPPITQPNLIQSLPLLNTTTNHPRSETIAVGGDNSEQLKGVGVPINDQKSTKAPNQNQQESVREEIEGQTTETITSLTNAVRNLTVGENLTDGQTSNNSLTELSPRRRSRQESDSESDSDKKNSRSSRDKRSVEKSKSREKDRSNKGKDSDRYKDRNSDRYSPDPYREKRDGRSRRYRDRRYEDDTDYYSDKERRSRNERERDYERKYASLKKEKDKRHRDRDHRDYRDPRRDDYYYRRYGDDYGADNRNSRPSSRSDSMHESYRDRRHESDPRRPRDRDRERDRYRNRDHRDVYNPYQNVAYDPYNPYYQHYQYYENLRRTNPQAYAEWYRKYYQQAAGSTASYAGEDRASVHSGRSSANDELVKDRYTRQSFYSQSNYYGQNHSISSHYGLDNSSITYTKQLDQTDHSMIYEDQQSSVRRLTPAKFSTAHLKASISSGKLIRIPPNYPMDGQAAVVDVCNLQFLLEHDPNFIELNSFPGPLVKGVTHKKQIIEYCDAKIREANSNRDIVDVESYILMWELLILLVRQNGTVVGADIAELLLKNRPSEPIHRPSSVLSTTSSNLGDKQEISETVQPLSEQGSTQSVLKEDEVTRKFREYLLYGSCQEALEWAMKHGLWGHALFLASKLDKRTYANVMMRFANGLTLNDPLQTLYQLLSGKMPAVVTCVSDEKWGDWRPHLAMILSNSTQRPELNCKAITQLGDTLLHRGSLYAAQFCYLMAQVGFGKHNDPNTRLVLLGSDHRKVYPQFVTNEAIHMTEIYEFACSLNEPEFYISEFSFYKYVLATKLADFGLLQRSLQYLELLAGRVIHNPNEFSKNLLDGICALADKLKFYDPLGDAEEEESTKFDSMLETSRPDNSWLKDLRAIQVNYQPNQTMGGNNQVDNSFVPQDDIWQQEQQEYDQQQQIQFEQQQHYQESAVWSLTDPPSQDTQPQQNSFYQEQQQQQQQQQNYWPGQQQQQPWGEHINQYGQQTNSIEHNNQQQEGFYHENSNNNQSEQRVEKKPTEEPIYVQPQISMPNQSNRKNAFSDEPLPQTKQDNSVKSQAPSNVKPEGNQNTSGWFGGIFSKLSMKPKNQMKLPDDKNPKIVWDENNKKWVNVDADPNDAANEFKPPPKMPSLIQTPQMQSTDVTLNNSLSFGSANLSVGMTQGPMSLPALSVAPKEEVVVPPRPTQSNMFKMQKRNLKNAYVDVFKQNGVKPVTEGVPVPEQVPMIAPAQMNFFIPQPVANTNAPVNFLTPGGAPAPIGDSQEN
ncbi:hypothetical protein ABEB36_005430 [Hypothenemus hampei]|uniref:Protein transport protein sec16 n=1 Tax=Hypothenemus hampei TaxID=57062 RepID=A0ABD1EY73_HYPHA